MFGVGIGSKVIKLYVCVVLTQFHHLVQNICLGFGRDVG
jgi:hypothetical protein